MIEGSTQKVVLIIGSVSITITLKVFIITISQYDRMQIILSDEKLDN